MSIFAVIMTTFSDAFDKTFREHIDALGSEVSIVKVTSEGDIKIYCLKFDNQLAGVNTDYFLDEFFKFDQDILALTFLRKEEGWVYE